jgi:hypothetical protein
VDLRNQSFGKWLVLYRGGQTAHGQFWVCRCRCDPTVKQGFLASAAKVELLEAALLEGWTHSCGCDYVGPNGIPYPRRYVVGQQFGSRLVLRFHPSGTLQRWRGYTCRCVCGVESFVQYPWKQPRCASCDQQARAQHTPIPSGWYGDVFVEGRVGVPQRNKSPRYRVRLANGSHRTVRAEIIRAGKLPRVGTRSKMQGHIDQVLAWLRAGVSKREASRRLGMAPNNVTQLLKRHPEIRALLASVPPTETLGE